MCKKFDTWLLNKVIIEEQIVIHQPANYTELCSVVYNTFGLGTGKTFGLWGDKNNFYLNHLNELLDMYKNARFLHIVRDGRDVACSYREVMAAKSSSPYAPKLKTEIADIALEWSINVMKIDAFMSTMPQNSAMTIRYEDMVLTPQLIVMAICEWLGISFEADMLKFYQQNKSKKLEPDLTMDWKKRTIEPISGAAIGRYQHLLISDEQAIFVETAGEALKAFGYI